VADFKKKFNDDYYTGSILQRHPAAGGSHGQGQVHRSGQGGGHGRHEFKSFNGESRCARPTTSCSRPVRLQVAKGRAKKGVQTSENTGYTFARSSRYEPYVASTPTSCQMKRPLIAVSARPCGWQGLFSQAVSLMALFERPVGPLFLTTTPGHGVFHHLLLNGVSYGLLLFMLSSGLTLIFSMMGVLNFAHASFYMLGAYFAFTTSWWASGRRWCLRRCWWAVLGAGFEKYCLRGCTTFGHVPELLITFGLSYIILELVQLVWGTSSVDLPGAGAAAWARCSRCMARSFPCTAVS
jgi:hypothetical protein